MELRDALGYRAKIGIVVPATNTIVEPEMAALQPPGVTNHVSRMGAILRPVHDLTLYRESLRQPLETPEALASLVACKPDAVIHGHSVNSFLNGLSGAHAMKAHLEALTKGVPVILPSLAILRALEVLNRPRVLGILTPWLEPADEACRAFFEAAGYTVAAIKGLKHPTPFHIAAADRDLLYRTVDEVNVAGVECIVKVGTNSAMARLVAGMEARLGKPILTINVVAYWAALRFLGIHDKLSGYGRLVETY
jgi:maleate isomerase